MPEVILTEDQARIVAESFGPVIVRDPSGNELGRLEPKPSPKEIAELKRRAASPGPFFSARRSRPACGRCRKSGIAPAGSTKPPCKNSSRLDAADPGHMRNKGRTE